MSCLCGSWAKPVDGECPDCGRPENAPAPPAKKRKKKR